MDNFEIATEIVDDVIYYTIPLGGELFLRTCDSRVRMFIEQNRAEEMVAILKENNHDLDCLSQ
jgi:hypothetical protein